MAEARAGRADLRDLRERMQIAVPPELRVPGGGDAGTLHRATIRWPLPPTPSRPQAVVLSGFALAACIALAWLAGLRISGRSDELSAVMHVPILLAAVLYGPWAGGLAGAAATGLLVSPLSPHAPQGVEIAAGSLNVAFGLASGALVSTLKAHRGALSNALDRLQSTYGRTLALMAYAVELRDHDTAGHSERVAANARAFGRELGVSHKELDDLYWAGLLHDIGKIAVPESVLHKTGRLTDDEWRVMRSHVSVGEELIRQTSPDFAAIATAVGAHHEKWDGTGYPRNQRGSQIPRLGRILAIVDVFEALTSARPYRTAMLPREAMEWIGSQSGSHFDPTLVPVFEAVLGWGMVVVAE